MRGVLDDVLDTYGYVVPAVTTVTAADDCPVKPNGASASTFDCHDAIDWTEKVEVVEPCANLGFCH
jgi:hypothetical protein